MSENETFRSVENRRPRQFPLMERPMMTEQISIRFVFKSAGRSLFFAVGLLFVSVGLGACSIKDKSTSNPSSGSGQGLAVVKSFVVAVDQNSLKTFSVAPSGSLAIAKSLAVADLGNYAVGHPNANFVYAITASGYAISSYSIAADGTLTELDGSPFALSNYHEHLVIDPKGRFLYTADGGTGVVNIFAVNSTTGALTSVSSTAGCGVNCFATMQAVDKSGKYYYIAAQGADGTTNGVYSYSINQTTGALTALAGSPYLFTTEGNGPYGLVISGDGKYLVTGNTGNTAYYGGLVSGFSSFAINSTTGALTYIGSIQTSVYPLQMSADSAGHIFSTDNGSGDLLSVQLDANGVLTGTAVIGAAAGSNGVVTDPTSSQVYSTTSAALYEFSLGAAGTLTPLSPSSVTGFTTGFGLSWATFR